MAHRVIYARSYVTRYASCLLDTTMVSRNNTITLKIHEERQSLLANTIAWPVGGHTNTYCPSNIAFIDKLCSSFRYLCDMCNFWRTYDTASQKTMHYFCCRHNMHVMIWWYMCAKLLLRLTSPLHEKLPGYPIFRKFSEIKRMPTTVCTRQSSSSPLLQAGIRAPGNEAMFTSTHLRKTGVSRSRAYLWVYATPTNYTYTLAFSAGLNGLQVD